MALPPGTSLGVYEIVSLLGSGGMGEVYRARDAKLGRETDLWISDIARGTLTRVTFAPGSDIHPAWTPDSRRLVYSSERDGARNVYWQAAGGSGTSGRFQT